MNKKRLLTSAVRYILVLMVLVGGLGFTQASGNDTAATEPPEPYLVKDISTKAIGPSPRQLTDVNGTLFFYAYDGLHGWELWKSDGTPDGTLLVKDIIPGGGDSCYAGCDYIELTNVNGTLFFRADDGVYGEELWVSDGTPDGTVMVKDINPGWDSSYPDELTNVNGMLFFSAQGDFGESLWKSDGTAEGTVLVKDIYPGDEYGP